MTIIASCGHTLTEVEGQGVLCSTKGYTREGNRAVSYGSYCFACSKKHILNLFSQSTLVRFEPTTYAINAHAGRLTDCATLCKTYTDTLPS